MDVDGAGRVDPGVPTGLDEQAAITTATPRTVSRNPANIGGTTPAGAGETRN